MRDSLLRDVRRAVRQPISVARRRACHPPRVRELAPHDVGRRAEIRARPGPGARGDRGLHRAALLVESALLNLTAAAGDRRNRRSTRMSSRVGEYWEWLRQY